MRNTSDIGADAARTGSVPGVWAERGLGKRDWLWIGVLAVAVFAVYAQTAQFDYVNLDDPVQISENVVVQKGLTWEGLRYAFAATPEGNFMPMTWLSHMAVVTVAGHGAGAHHFANVALHAMTAGLVYLFWRLATGAKGRSAVVAGLFALHPLRVESVAWISERKDVLSGVLWMLCLLAYLRFARRPAVGRYLLVALVFVVGLLSKSMLVTLPCVMLLLDFWPLDRLSRSSWRRVMLEKLPLFALAAVCAAITFVAQKNLGAVGSVRDLPITQRLWNMPSAYGTYLLQTIWPSGLGVMYPYLDSRTLVVRGTMGLATIAVFSVIAMLGRKKRPYIAVGWLWFLGTLVPVIGLVQVGIQSHADRYTYIPHIGLIAGAVWAIGDAVDSRRRARIAVLVATAASVLVLSGVTWRQTGFWRDSETLFARSLAVTRDNAFSEGNYAVALIDRREYAEAEKHLRRIVAMGAPAARDYHNLGYALLCQQRPEEAQYFIEAAVLGDPEAGRSWLLLGNIRLKREQWPGAVEAFRRALELGSSDENTRLNLAIAMSMSARPEDAAAEFEKLIAERPGEAPVLFNHGLLLVKQLKFDAAAIQFEAALVADPASAGSLYYLGVCRAWQSRFADSIALLQQAAALDPAYAEKARQDPMLGPLRGLAAFSEVLGEK